MSVVKPLAHPLIGSTVPTMNAGTANSVTHKPTNRVYGLDVFRAIAILFVLMGHSLEHSKVAPDIATFGHLGILGVELFFVLSGFLIGSIIMRLIDEKRFHSFADIALFWQRRWLRTLPMYFLALLAFIRFDYHGRHDLFDYPAYFVFMQNFADRIPDFFELSWSLAIEEHFYLWFPIAFYLWERLTKQSHLAIILTAVTFIVIAYSYRIYHPLFSDWNEYNRALRMVVLSRIDAIMFGILIAALKFYWHAGYVWLRRATPLTALAFLLLCVWWFANAPYLLQSRTLQINLFSVQAFVCALLLPWFEQLRSANTRADFFVITSKLSYSLYLLHILVIIAVNRLLARLGIYDTIYWNPFILYPLYFSLFYFVSWISYHLVEKPFLGLRDMPFSYMSLAKASWATLLVAGLLITCF
jgi:peptidoglycan/LPS O-acetylase OafA/YrhL